MLLAAKLEIESELVALIDRCHLPFERFLKRVNPLWVVAT